jgi:NAD(P)H dehydrogenase (quinone)
MSGPVILVSGAGGKLGRRVVDLLVESHYPGQIVAGTRDPGLLSGLKAHGVEVRRLDWLDEGSLGEAFAGVDRALIVSGDNLQKRAENQVRAVNAAVKAGVGYLSYTSMLSPELYQHIPIAPSHLATEQAMDESGVAYASLQNMWYADGLIDQLRRAIASGSWATPAPDGKVAYVTREDCARVAAAVLSAPVARTGRFVVTGPEALSPRDLAAFGAELSGRPIEVVGIGDEDLAAGMRAGHVPEEVISLVVGIEQLNRSGDAAHVTDTVEHLTGSPPQSVRDFLAANKAALTE